MAVNQKSETVKGRDGSVDSESFLKRPVHAPVSRPRLNPETIRAMDQERIQRGEELARAIYDLTNVSWEKDLSVYIETIKESVAGYPSQMNQAILQTAKEKFLEHYQHQIRERGESPKIEDQIVKRVGRENRARVEEVLDGFNARRLARFVWKAHQEKDQDAILRIMDDVFELSNDQVRELREAYAIQPLIDLAKSLEEALHRKSLTGNAHPDVDRIEYILFGRTENEIRQIIFQYDEKYHFERKGKEDVIRAFREEVQDLDEGTRARIVRALRGFQAEVFADEIREDFENYHKYQEAIYHSGVSERFSGEFREARPECTIQQRELLLWPYLEPKLRKLSAQQFRKVNRILEKESGIVLSPDLYSCNRESRPYSLAREIHAFLQSARRRVIFDRDDHYLSEEEKLRVRDEFRLQTTDELKSIIRERANEVRANDILEIIHEVLEPLRWLHSFQIDQVLEAYTSLYGEELRERINSVLHEVQADFESPYAKSFIQSSLLGIDRLGTKADLFELFPSKAKREEQKKVHEAAEKDRSAARNLIDDIEAVLENDDLSQARKVKYILDSYREASLSVRRTLLHSWLERKESGFLMDLYGFFENSRFQTQMGFLAEGLEPRETAKEILEDPNSLRNLFTEPKRFIEAVFVSFRTDNGREVESLFEGARELEFQTDPQIEAVLAFKNAESLWRYFSSKRSESEFDGEIPSLLASSSSKVFAIEAAYNRLFGTFQHSLMHESRSFTEQLRYQASLGKLLPVDYARCILKLEGASPDLVDEVQNLLNNESMIGRPIIELQELFAANTQYLFVLQTAFNALHDEATLRERIHRLRLPLEIINRTLLLLDGYDPRQYVDLLMDATRSLRNHELAEAVMAILSQDGIAKGKPFPTDENWISEMYHHIRLGFEIHGGEALLSLLRRHGVLEQDLVSIAKSLYGEAYHGAEELLQYLMRYQNDRHTGSKVYLQAIIDFYRSQPVEMRERMESVFDGLFLGSLEGVPLRAHLVSITSGTYFEEVLNEALQENKAWNLPEEDEPVVPLRRREDEGLSDLEAFLSDAFTDL